MAGYPEGHVDSQDKAKDIVYLKEKVDAGADFIVTQLFYDINSFVNWEKQCRDAGISVPIVPGVMPIQSHQAFRRIINLCNTSVPVKILEDLNDIKVCVVQALFMNSVEFDNKSWHFRRMIKL